MGSMQSVTGEGIMQREYRAAPGFVPTVETNVASLKDKFWILKGANF